MTGPTAPPPATPPPDDQGHSGWAVAFAVIVALVVGAGIAAAIGHDDTPPTPKTVNVTQGTTVQATPTVKVTTPPPTTVTVQAPTVTKTVPAPARTETTTTP